MVSALYKRVEGFLPRFYKENIQQKLVYAAVNIDSREWTGFFFLYSLGVGITAVIVSFFFLQLSWYYYLLIFIAGFLLLQGVSELLLIISVHNRTVFIEKILPDVLSMIASNIKSGMTIDRALLLSIRDEFGTFKKELLQVSKETLAGENLGESLMEIGKRINSRLVKRSLSLIVEGVNGGGELSLLLESTASDLRKMDTLRKEIRAGVLMYTMVLVLANCLGAPLLFGVSLFEVENIASLVSEMPTDQIPQGTSFINFTPFTVDIGFLQIIMVSSILINGLFGGLMIGILESGDVKDGIKIVPVLMGISIGAYFLTSYLIRIVFTGISV